MRSLIEELEDLSEGRSMSSAVKRAADETGLSKSDVTNAVREHVEQYGGDYEDSIDVLVGRLEVDSPTSARAEAWLDRRVEKGLLAMCQSAWEEM